MRDASIENLKLSVTNIRSTLLNSNKQLRRVKIRKKSLIARFEKQKNFRKEESRLESPLGKIGSGISGVAGKITAPAKSFFDRMMDFIKLIGFGILLNSLPGIISTIQDFFSSDFGKGLLKVIKFAGNMLLKVIDLTITYGPSVISEIKNWFGKIKDIIVDPLLGTTNTVLGLLNVFEKDWGGYLTGLSNWISNLFSGQGNTSGNTGNTGNTGGGANYGQYSRGGTVRGDSTVEERRNPVYQPRKSGPLKAAQRNADNGFLSFKEGVDNIQDAAMKDERNMMALADMVKTFKSYSLLFGDERSPGSTPRSQSKSQSRSQPGPTSGPSPGKTTGIVGRVGSTGSSTGPHIHIETGNGYGGKGGNIPDYILNNVIVGGKPLSSYTKTSPIGFRNNPTPGYHYGMDFSDPGIDGAAITLQGGLQLDKNARNTNGTGYDEGYNAGYGNSIIITYNGKQYLIGHLSSGPESGPSGGPLNMVSSLRSRNLKMNMSEEDQQSVFMLAIQPQEVMIPFPMPIPIKSGQNVASSTPKSSALWRV